MNVIPSTDLDICPRCMETFDKVTPRGYCQACFDVIRIHSLCLECLSVKKTGRNPVCVDCLVCEHDFQTYRSGKRKAIGCKTCKRMAPSKPRMAHVCFLKEREEPWTCDLCNQVFSSSSSAVTHLTSCVKIKKPMKASPKTKRIKFEKDVKTDDGPLPEKRCLFFLHMCFHNLGVVRESLLLQVSSRLSCPPLQIKAYLKEVVDHILEKGRMVLARQGKSSVCLYKTDLAWLRVYMK